MENIPRTPSQATRFRDAFALQAKPKEDNTRHIPRPGFSSHHEHPSGSLPKALGQNLLVGIQTRAFPESQTLGLSVMMRGEVSKCSWCSGVPPPSRNSQEGPGRDTDEGAELVPSQSQFKSHLLAPIHGQLGWKGAARAGLVFPCSDTPTPQPVLLLPRDAPGCSGSQTQLRS